MGNLENDQSDNVSNPGLLGEYLKQRRLEKNFSLEKLSQKTKISVNILKSLESNDYRSLPSAAYIKGFVISYAKVLGLPLDESIQKMEFTYSSLLGKPFPALNHTKLLRKDPATTSAAQATLQTTPAPSKKAASTPSPQDVISSGDSLIRNTKSILPIAIFACIILLFVGGYKLVSSIVDSEVNGVKTKNLGPKIETSSALINDEDKVPAPKAEVLAVPAANDATSAQPAETTEEKVTDASTGSEAPEEKKEVEASVSETKPETKIQRNFPPIRFFKVRNNLYSINSDAAENNDPSAIPEKVRNAMNPQMQNVYIKATEGDTWMSYKVDSKPIESVIIPKGDDIFLQGAEIRMFLGNVNVTKIFYNNSLIDTPNKSGVKSLIFPQSSISKYQLPLFPKAKDDIFYTAEEYQKRMKLEEEELGKEVEAEAE